MVGEIVAMPAPAFQEWLGRSSRGNTMSAAGKILYTRFGCGGCHGGTGAGGNESGATVRAPPLIGLYGAPVPLSSGQVVVADDLYLHDAIVAPNRQIVAGYADIMPSFAGQLNEEDILRLIAYIRSLTPEKSQ
jgi:cytochrome c oxidase subunit 2